jgi:SAM-dependent methyltransferase
MDSPCRICGNITHNRRHIAQEMQFGLREEFAYVECSACGCLQIAEIPPDINRYYPPNYYSYSNIGGLRAFLKRQQWAYSGHRINPLGWLRCFIFGPDRALESVVRLDLPKAARVLDIGGGQGELLRALKHLGYEDLTCIDPYIPSAVNTGGVRLLKVEAAAHEGEYDLIMLHHSLEHMPDQFGTLREIKRLLAPEGTAIIRIPIVSSQLWHEYGAAWVSLDAPRHFYLHTPRSLKVVTDSVGLKIQRTIYDATFFSYLMSEQYRRGVPLMADNSYMRSPLLFILALSRVRRLLHRAEQENAACVSDWACFYLTQAAERTELMVGKQA